MKEMTLEDASTSSRSKGRPVSIDRDAVARVALELFADRGYEQTSMEDIARAAGVGRKSLYRHFANKADLVWGGMEPVVEAVERALGASAPAAASPSSVLEALREALIAAVAGLPDLGLTRGRLRLISKHPELMGRSYDFLGSRRERTAVYLTTGGISEETARYLCAALSAASFEAWLQWAASEESSPVPFLQRGLAVLTAA